ncbi:hypothetical protein K432DRAFT_443585 [Lepidopterella palustris CBS 459.81]|uniref:SET domain-containing protein n=1 Tax=Lepidopterella palustris CBS 459.81 TaxID=1314670 RepID=A0A8E2EA77_9PEZI|nr:hypothetical protein K432DRAFT_443585 [Lepidopterella palustris CBS 459.81]
MHKRKRQSVELAEEKTHPAASASRQAQTTPAIRTRSENAHSLPREREIRQTKVANAMEDEKGVARPKSHKFMVKSAISSKPRSKLPTQHTLRKSEERPHRPQTSSRSGSVQEIQPPEDAKRASSGLRPTHKPFISGPKADVPHIDLDGELGEGTQAYPISLRTTPEMAPEEPVAAPTAEPDASTIPVSLEAVEAVLKKHIAELHKDHACFVKHTLPRHRRCFERQIRSNNASTSGFSKVTPTIFEDFLQNESPFASMKSIQLPNLPRPAGQIPMMKLSQEVFSGRSSKGVRSYLSIPITKYRSTAVQVPPYTDYVSLRDNVLAENNRKLLYWPYFDDEEHEDLNKKGLWSELDQRFDMVNEHRPRRLLQAEQCRVYRAYTETFLEEIGIDWKHILFWLLAENTDIASIDVSLSMGWGIQSGGMLDTSSFLLQREPHCVEDFNRGHKKWKAVFSNLPRPSVRELKLAAHACTAFLKSCGFSLWHIARLSNSAQLTRIEPLQHEAGFTYRSLACRVCHLHDCPFHGELREEPDDAPDAHTETQSSHASRTRTNSVAASESEKSETHKNSGKSSVSDATSDSDSDSDPDSNSDSEIINYRKHVNAIPREHPEDLNANGSSNNIQQAKHSTNYWLAKTDTYLLHKRRPFYPCSHEGSCEEAQCRCFQQKIACEKTCACSLSCKRRFRGCTCAKNPRIRVCWKSPKCECALLNRECDADLCGTCGAAEVLDPVNRYNEEIVKDKCANVYIQRNMPRRTLLGHSEVQGFGLYVGEKVKADDYLGEYKGEIITNGEMERRGSIYHHLKTNYLFDLNKAQQVDSTRAGNKFRFINNSNEESIINCYPHVMLCNTVVRIGMYAKRDLKIGEELFFNYGYPKEATKGFWEKGQPKGNGRLRKASKATPVSEKSSKDDVEEDSFVLKATTTTTTTTRTTTTMVKTTAASSSLVSRSKNGKLQSTKVSNRKGIAIPKAPRPLADRRAQTARAREALRSKRMACLDSDRGDSDRGTDVVEEVIDPGDEEIEVEEDEESEYTEDDELSY